MAAGVYRRTPIERVDEKIAWDRPDVRFFAAGACHVLAYTCVAAFPEQPIGIAALRKAGDRYAFHAYATWRSWAFDASGWNPVTDLVAVNEKFERCHLERLPITTDIAAFCREHHSRLPHDFWRDPTDRARTYVGRFPTPWSSCVMRSPMSSG